MRIPLFFLVGICLAIFSCSSPQKEVKQTDSAPELPARFIDVKHEMLQNILNTNSKIEVLASGFTWSEGPVWVEELDALLFTDVPKNTIYKWSKNEGLQTYLNPSGYTGQKEGKEGANGLIIDDNQALVLCQHGDRRVARMQSSLADPKPDFETLAHEFKGKRFNSPNDLVLSRSGNYYFTDPPYGLSEDDQQELGFQGVYKLDSMGQVALLIDSLSRPNGIALSLDESILYVAVSDPRAAKYYAYTLDENGNVASGKVLLDVTPLIGDKYKGLPDGLKIGPQGNLFATGPGGVLVISPEGDHLGTINTGFATANCAFNSDKSMLYMTAHNHLMRVDL